MQESTFYQYILAKGEANLILRILNRRFGEISPEIGGKIRSLPVERLEQLGEDLLDFSGFGDLVAWLARN